MKKTFLSQSIATILASALIITAPGLPMYQAFALPGDAVKGTVVTPAGGAGIVVKTGLPGTETQQEATQGYNGLSQGQSNTTFGRKGYGVNAVSPSPARQTAGELPLPKGGVDSDERISKEQVDQWAAAQETGASDTLSADVSERISSQGGRGTETGSAYRSASVSGVNRMSAEQAKKTDEKKVVVNTWIEKVKKHFSWGNAPTLKAEGTLPADIAAAPSVAPVAATEGAKDSGAVIYPQELTSDSHYQNGLAAARAWAPGDVVTQPSEAKAKENFVIGVSHGIVERTNDWSKATAFTHQVGLGVSMDNALSRTFTDGAAAESAPVAPQPAKKEEKANTSVWWFLGGLLVAQVGIEALGIAMPMMMRERFGGFSAMAQIAVFASLASMMGRLTGGGIADKLGLKKTYVGSTIIRLISISAMIMFLLGPGAVPSAASWLVTNHLPYVGAILSGVGQMVLPLLTSADAWVTGTGFFGFNPKVVLTSFYAFNGFVGGISVTAEMTLPQAMLGNQRAVLERFFAMEQWLMEIVGSAGPKIGGKMIANHGFIPALLLYPASFVVAIGLFIFGIQLPKTEGSKAATATDAKDATETPKAAEEAKKPAPGFFKRVGAGAAIVFKNPIMRTAFLAYTAYMILNPLLYSIVGPAFGLHMAGGDAKLGSDVASWITALYSMGGLMGGLVMWREGILLESTKTDFEKIDSRKIGVVLAAFVHAVTNPMETIKKAFAGLMSAFVAWYQGLKAAAKEGVRSLAGFLLVKTPFSLLATAFAPMNFAIDVVVANAYLGPWTEQNRNKDTGKLTDDGEKNVLKDSTLLWMTLGTIGLGSFGTLLMATPVPAYGAMIVFGIAQVIANLKLRTLAMSEATPEQRTLVNAFLGAASTGLIAVMLNMTGKLFDGFTGVTPFMYFDGALVGMGATYVWLTATLKRHSENPGSEPGVKMRAMGILLGVMYASLGAYAGYMIGSAVWGLVGPHVLAWGAAALAMVH